MSTPAANTPDPHRGFAPPDPDDSRMARQHWMGVLARADADQVIARWDALKLTPDYSILRAAEPGLVMVRGRAGGTGDRFNLGEMVVSRCVVRLQGGQIGFSYRAGRDRRAAEVAAVIDAMLQTDDWHDLLEGSVVTPLADAEARQRAQTARRSAATRVDFFTMSRHRGEQK